MAMSGTTRGVRRFGRFGRMAGCALGVGWGLASFATPAHGQAVHEWSNANDGLFREAANWHPFGVPGPLDTALLGGERPYQVLVDHAPAGSSTPLRIHALDIANDRAVLLLARGRTLELSELRGGGLVRVPGASHRAEPALLVAGGGSIGARVRLESRFSAQVRNTSADAAVTITESGLITGEGEVWGDFENYGVIEAASAIDLVRGTVRQIGAGVIRGTRGASVGLSSGRVMGGSLRLPEGGAVSMGSGGVVQELTMACGPGEVCGLGGASGTLIDAVLEGAWALPSGNSLLVQRRLAGPGELIVNRHADHTTCTLQLDGGATLDMRVLLNAPLGSLVSTRARVAHARSGAATIGPDGLVTGRGGVFGRIHNHGVIQAVGPDGIMEFDYGGQITQGVSGIIRCEGGRIRIVEARLGGGLWLAGRGAEAGRIESVRVDNTIADARFEGDWQVGGLVTLEGDIAAASPAGAAMAVNAGGGSGANAVRLAPGATVGVPIGLHATGADLRAAQLQLPAAGEAAVLGPDARLSGRGQLRLGACRVEGDLAPGLAGRTGGLFELDQAHLRLAPTARLLVDVFAPAGAAAHDRIAGTGSVALDGTLVVGFPIGYEPAATDRYEVVRATSVQGRFARVEVESAGAVSAVGPAHVVYAGDSATLVLCAADRNGDGVLDVFDFMAFQDEFTAGDASADLDGDGRLTVLDFLAFQDRFVRGC